MIRSIFFKTMLLWVVAASLLLISPYARAETVLSEDESDWYMTIMPSDTAGEVHYLFFSRLKPGKSWSEIKTFNEVEGYDFDPAMLAIVGDEKIMGLAWVYPAPLDCELIPRPQAETDEKGELFGCITLFTVSTEGADLESFRSNLLTDPAAVMVFIAAENWADPLPEEDAIIILASAMLPQSSDSDDDYIPDAVDNCPEAANSEQLDSDADGVGDQCDTEEPSGASDDEDGDGVVDESDICPDTVSGQTVDANGCSEAQLAASGTVSTEGGLGPAAASGEGACSAVPAAPINPMAFLIISAALAALLARRRK